MSELKELTKELCDKSGCHHKCHDTKDCVVEDEAELLISNKSQCVDCIHNEICQFYKAMGATVICHPCGFYEANAGYRKQSEGEWISNRQTDELICNLCGAIAPVDCEKERFYKSNFCPNCGSKMKGGEKQ